MTRTLVLVRHGQSEWNLKNLFTAARRGPDRTGPRRGRAAGELKARGLKFDVAFTSTCSAAEDLQHILDIVGQSDLETIRNQALNEATMATCPASTRKTRAGNGARTGACLAPLLRHRAPGGEA